ncbi:MAG: response regulator transcription factor [Chloroflexi bacterium]|nr:response regulator transcription factor [Chloroflexota bacterium]
MTVKLLMFSVHPHGMVTYLELEHGKTNSLDVRTSMNIVICDDDPNQRDTIRLCFVVSGSRHETVEFELGSDMLEYAGAHEYDLVFLDMGLPDMDGLEVLTKLRQLSNAPVIVISGNERLGTVAKALSIGADDYITKPFEPIELMARVEAVRRRSSNKSPRHKVFNASGLSIDFDRMIVMLDGKQVDLNLTEWDVLRVLLSEPGVVVDYRTLKQRAWGDSSISDAAVHMAMRRLRQKIDSGPGDERLIRSHRGIGYSVEEF